MAKLSDARRTLLKAKESAQGRLKQLEDERREIKATMRSLNAAIKALHNPKRSSRQIDPSANVTAVIEVIEAALSVDGKKTRIEIEATVGEKLTQTGESSPELSVLVEQALSDQRFVNESDGYALNN